MSLGRVRLALLASAAMTVAGCAVFPPVGASAPPRIQVDWATPLYTLEPFAYHPREAGAVRVIAPSEEHRGGLLVVPSKDRRVRGLDATSGEVLWSLATRGPNVAAPAVLGGDLGDLIIGSMDGHVYRVNRRDGQPVWTSDYPGEGGVAASPVVAAGRVFVTSIDNRITALSLKTGERLWTRERPHASEFTITGQAGATLLGDDVVVTGFSDGQLVAFAREDGATKWQADLSAGKAEFVDVDSTPLLVDDVLVASSYRRGLFGVDPETGDVRWLVKGEGFGTPVALEGSLYVPQANGRLVAVKASDGTVRWVARFGSEQINTPGVSEKYVIVPTGGALTLLDRVTGRALSRFDDSRGFSAPPEVAQGTVYTIGNSGTVYAIGLY